jgi:SAM-dependent methyltransferase
MSWTIDRLTTLATGYWQACVLSAGIELRLFEVLEGKGRTAKQVAEELQTSAEHTEQLLDALTALGLLEKLGTAEEEDNAKVYRIRPSAAQYLTESGSHCILDTLRKTMELYPVWRDLAKSVRSGEPAGPSRTGTPDDMARTRQSALSMHSRELAMAPALIPTLDMSGRSRLLDVGCGPGTFSSFLADKYSGLHVTLFDLPTVLKITEELLADHRSAAKFTFHAGDYHSGPLPGEFDALLLCGALHLEEEASAEDLMKVLFKALKPGGTIFIVDMMVERERTKPLSSALSSINLMLTSSSGRVFSDDDVRRFLLNAGFTDTRCTRLEDCPYWVIAADKPHADEA